MITKDLSGEAELALLGKLGTIRRETLASEETKLEIMETMIVCGDGCLEECVATASDSGKAAIVLVAKIRAIQKAGGYVINERNHKVIIVNDMWTLKERDKGGG